MSYLHRIRKIEVSTDSTKLAYVEWDRLITYNYFIQIKIEVIKRKVVLGGRVPLALNLGPQGSSHL